jgi:predicted dehydrogenase
MDRRSFLVASAASQMRIRGANDRIRAGIIGAGGRGRYLTGQFKELGVEMAGVCDIYEANLQAGLKEANTGARSFDDYRKVLDDKSFDAVIVATPDHWHARMVIDAVEAGKDVYVEKPMAHKIDEGFQVIEAVRRTKRVVQVGMQRRSSDMFLEAKSILDSGQLGDIRLVTSAWYNNTASLTQKQLAGKLDWNKWLGSAPKRPLDPLRYFNWYYFWDYSGGLLIGQAAHILDCIQWFMGSKEPIAVTCTGGRVNLPGAEVPETATIAIEYPENYLATFTLGYKAMRYNQFNDQIKQFHGNKALRRWPRVVRAVSGVFGHRHEAEHREEEAGQLQFSGAAAYPQFHGVHSQPQGPPCASGSGPGDQHRAVHDDGLTARRQAVEVEFAVSAGGRLTKAAYSPDPRGQ